MKKKLCAELMIVVLLFCTLAMAEKVKAYAVSAVAGSRYQLSIHSLVKVAITTDALFAGNSALTMSAFNGRGNYCNYGGIFTGDYAAPGSNFGAVNCDVKLSLIGFPLDSERMIGVGLARLSVLEDAIPFYFTGARVKE
ncbi:MAG: hypothetical protein NTV89_00310 [Proteobacteria bacterium]|nr:hypothetical protein [Pseudomonadota bacterium]